MRDQIIEAYLKDFIEEHALANLNEAQVFERFASHCVVSKHHPETFDVENVCLGGAGDLGIDGAAILVNDHLVTSTEEIDHFKKLLRRLEVKFLFIQARSSLHLDSHHVAAFIQGVRYFFERSLPAEANDSISSLHNLQQHIYKSSIDIDTLPSCYLYYVCTGKSDGEAPLRSTVNLGLDDLRKTGLFSTVDFLLINSESLKRLYRQLKQKITREILFDKHTILPPMSGVQEAYIGILPCTEYLKLISDEDGDLNKRLFYDNVRDFQGYNPVNHEIETTIRDAGRNDRFVLLNNGVTIVARDANKVGAKFRLNDYQIVNGCQTSHMLFFNRKSLTDAVYLPIKLVVTSDPEVTNQVIQGTNRQTEVKIEALQSLAPFHKTLEEFYQAASRNRQRKLYYERRSKQYEHLAISRKDIITLAVQTQCFVAMFLNEPHSTHRYYGELLKSYEERMFQEAHSPMPYFVGGFALVAMERMFASGELPWELRPFRFQLLMVFRLLHEGQGLPYLNNKAIQQYCEKLIEVLDDDRRVREGFLRAAGVVRDVLDRTPRGPQPRQRTKAFTGALVAACGSRGPLRNAEIDLRKGRVKWFSDVRGFGFITSESGEDLFVHYSAIRRPGYPVLYQDEAVEFAAIETPRGSQAIDVRIVK